MPKDVEGNTNVWSQDQWKCRRDTLGGALHRDADVTKEKDVYLFYRSLTVHVFHNVE